MSGLTLTIFGGTGDLTFRKLLPALYNMDLSGGLGAEDRVVIVGRRAYDDDAYRELARDWVRKFARLPFTYQAFDAFAARLSYRRMDFTDLAAYSGLDGWYRERGAENHLFYLAVAPRYFGVIAKGLAQVSGAPGGKAIIEKPFGENLSAAGELNAKLEAVFPPDHIYRIDHYLGKEMVRNILTIRFANPIFSYLWDARHIEFIQISAMEDVGVENRGGYYDTSGALKDMVQNHLFQILSIVAMERPEKFSTASMHNEQLKVLRALRPAGAEPIGDTLALGRYGGYREEPKVDPASTTETYAALRLFVDNDRWRHMPFYIRTGKKTGRRETEVAVVFRRSEPGVPRNVLVIKIQPSEGVHLQFNIKRPGDFHELQEAQMDFCQSCDYQNRINTPEAYERLLGACVRGERSWFSQWDQIEAGWTYIEALKELARQAGLTPEEYAPGTPGPRAAESLLGRFGHQWL